MEVDEESGVDQRHQVSMKVSMGHRYTCQVNGSWSEKDEWMGMGFILLEADEVLLQGQKCTKRSPTPIHQKQRDSYGR